MKKSVLHRGTAPISAVAAIHERANSCQFQLAGFANPIGLGQLLSRLRRLLFLELGAVIAVGAFAFALSGCATLPANDFQRARPLGKGHIESGLGLSTGRMPANNPALKTGGNTDALEEDWSPLVRPSAYFRLGVTDKNDVSLQLGPNSLGLAAKHNFTDRDEFMSALIAGLGFSTTAGIESALDDNLLSHMIHVDVSAPLARRLAWFAEGHIRPNLSFIQTYAEKDDPAGRLERWYWSGHGGVALGASLAVWRVRIVPEVNLVGAWRGDQGKFFFTAYPGIGAFIVY